MSLFIPEKNYIQSIVLPKKKFNSKEVCNEWICSQGFNDAQIKEHKNKTVFIQQKKLSAKKGYTQALKLKKQGVELIYQFPHLKDGQ